MENCSLSSTNPSREGARSSATTRAGRARVRATRNGRRRQQMVAGGGGELAGAEHDGGAWRPEEPEGEGASGGVRGDRRLTGDLMDASDKHGEASNGRDGPRRPAAGVGEDGRFHRLLALPHTRLIEEEEERMGKLQRTSPELGVAGNGGNRRNSPEARG